MSRTASTLALAALLGATLAAGPALLATASGAQPAAASEDPDVSMWTQRLDAALQRLKRARTAVAESDAEYAKTRQRHRLRGETNTDILSTREAAQRELEAAEAAWPDLLERARRAGVPPGVLRPYEDAFTE